MRLQRSDQFVHDKTVIESVVQCGRQGLCFVGFSSRNRLHDTCLRVNRDSLPCLCLQSHTYSGDEGPFGQRSTLHELGKRTYAWQILNCCSLNLTGRCTNF